METWTGKVVNVLFVDADVVNIEDAARSLSMQCRFGGHVDKFYSVANHCVLMAEWFMDKGLWLEAKWALLHELDEVYLSDMITPVKYLDEMKPYRLLCKTVQKAALEKFNLYGKMPPSIKELDERIVIAEARKVKPLSRLARKKVKTADIKIRVLTQKQAEKRFLEIYKELEKKLGEI